MTDHEGTLDVETFRRKATQDLLEDRRALGGWLERFSAHASQGFVAPHTSCGREYEGFGETFCRTLSWYKPHKLKVFNPLGWCLDVDTIDRVGRGFRRLIAEALGDPARLSAGRASWLRSYDVGPISHYTAIDEKFSTVTGGPTGVVLDFGSGIGRQGLLWGFERNDTCLISVDAIESLYLLQHELYRRLWGPAVFEYFIDPDRCREAAFEPTASKVGCRCKLLSPWLLGAVRS